MNLFLKALGNTRVYPLTDRRISGLSHQKQVSALGESGARIIQLREKELPARDFYVEAAAAMNTARQLGVQIIINDRVDIAHAIGADGVHLGQEDLRVDAARRILGSSAIIGVSTHNLEQLKHAATMPVDYIAIGPIFHTRTKQSVYSPLGVAMICEAREVVGDVPLVAIGGITTLRSEEVLNAGAAAVALIADYWKSNKNSPESGPHPFQV